MTESNTIDVYDAHQNNLKNLNLKIHKHAITVFTGLSGAGKSSLVFDTIAANSRRELNETFPSFTQQYLPKYGAPEVGHIDNLPVAIVIQQKKIGKNPRSTLATYTGIYSLMRLLFSRAGKPWVGYSDTFSFNLPQGMCKNCQGLGYVDNINPDKIVDYNKSLNEGAITFVSFGPHTWRWNRYAHSGLFDNDKPLKDYTKEELHTLLYAPQHHLKHAPKIWRKSILYEGLIPRIKRSIIESREGQHHKQAIAEIVDREVCPVCHGAKLRQPVLKCKINGKNIADVLQMDLVHALKFLKDIKTPLVQNLLRELDTKIESLIDLGLGYLTLDRNTETMSGGETQRIKIAKFMNSSLVDMVYILDEPSVGLHPNDIQLIKNALVKLKDKGNTVLIVEHNPELIPIADYVVEVGPKAGKGGGHITFNGTYDEMLYSNTITSRYLKAKLSFDHNRPVKSTLDLNDVSNHNLKNVSVKIPMGVETVISGVAGSGKSSLIDAVKSKLTQPYIDLSQDAVGANIRSTPATYLDILTEIRKLFGKANHVSRALFSYNGKGRCPKCKGRGVMITNMAFMDPVIQTCEMCHGKRYSKEALQYKYHGKNISEVLTMLIHDAVTFFKDTPDIHDKLYNMQRVGLDYLSLGQSLSTLSGGELQRLKLAVQLNQTGTVYLLDEPTAGLHMQDTAKMIKLFDELVDAGNTLIIVEHNLQVISKADWMIDVGPHAGNYGGQILFSGRPQAALDDPKSVTGQALKRYNQARN
ncbi:daunorubicin resistance protein DrrC [Philodulcilactobacillus myokoensis]|uniref:UvrABC system protein A n=1 Tax=Philodulcilactobacillus myokoensis TaxID=2929573 RepID=A0A9W6AZN2_9LACO|nr:excinuclease ABC subunit UvrA [Philodulcilactobacillus myokoensis]GLB46330.1 daunorubicin resistance protein DrrC [Philodulcilactobacillus myokoensis]